MEAWPHISTFQNNLYYSTLKSWCKNNNNNHKHLIINYVFPSPIPCNRLHFTMYELSRPSDRPALFQRQSLVLSRPLRVALQVCNNLWACTINHFIEIYFLWIFHALTKMWKGGLTLEWIADFTIMTGLHSQPTEVGVASSTSIVIYGLGDSHPHWQFVEMGLD